MDRSHMRIKTMKAPEGASEGDHDSSSKHHTSQTVGSSPSTFERSTAKKWQRLTNETPSEIGPMIDAMRGTQAQDRVSKKEIVNEYWKGYIISEETRFSQEEFQVPPILKVTAFLEDNPATRNKMEGLVDRLVADEKTYRLLLREAKESLKNPNFKPEEAKKRLQYLGLLEKGLFLLGHELDKAHFLLDQQRLREKAARELAAAKEE